MAIYADNDILMHDSWLRVCGLSTLARRVTAFIINARGAILMEGECAHRDLFLLGDVLIGGGWIKQKMNKTRHYNQSVTPFFAQ